MTRVTQPLRDEHQELLPHVEALRLAARAAGQTPLEVLRAHVDEAYDFLVGHLIPHAKAEDRALYPVVGRVMGAPETTATMSRDHVEVVGLVERLGDLRAGLGARAPEPATVEELREVLYGLHAVVKLHFAKEEEVYLPLLDERLSADEASEMFERMEAAATLEKAAVA